MSEPISNQSQPSGAKAFPAAPAAAPCVDLSGLNERQARIARTLDEPLFVEAGAGSGKTFTLTQRVAWALSPGSGADGPRCAAPAWPRRPLPWTTPGS